MRASNSHDERREASTVLLRPNAEDARNYDFTVNQNEPRSLPPCAPPARMGLPRWVEIFMNKTPRWSGFMSFS